MNHAVVFLKPIADNKKTESFVLNYLSQHGIEVVETNHKSSKQLATLIDSHYSVISTFANGLLPHQIRLNAVQKQKFKERFGQTWDAAVSQGKVHNMRTLGVRVYSQEHAWDHEATEKLKLQDGLKVARVRMVGEDEYFLINGFYEGMRQAYVAKNASVTAYIVQFNAAKCSWAKFRGDLIGTADPEKAPKQSLRFLLLHKWKELEMTQRPDHGMNGIHASAGPIEGLLERTIWFGKKVEEDPFGQSLLRKNISRETIEYMMKNPYIKQNGDTDSLFCLTENLDETAAVKFCVNVQEEAPELLV